MASTRRGRRSSQHNSNERLPGRTHLQHIDLRLRVVGEDRGRLNPPELPTRLVACSPLASSAPVLRLHAARCRRRRRLRLPQWPRRGWGCCTTIGCARTRRLTGRNTRRTPSGCAPSGASSTPRASRPGMALEAALPLPCVEFRASTFW